MFHRLRLIDTIFYSILYLCGRKVKSSNTSNSSNGSNTSNSSNGNNTIFQFSKGVVQKWAKTNHM